MSWTIKVINDIKLLSSKLPNARKKSDPFLFTLTVVCFPGTPNPKDDLLNIDAKLSSWLQSIRFKLSLKVASWDQYHQ